MRRLRILVLVPLLLGGLDALAIKDKDNQGRWEKAVDKGPDSKVPGFLVNLGSTGARAVLTEKTFVVKYVFPGSPAVKRLQAAAAQEKPPRTLKRQLQAFITQSGDSYYGKAAKKLLGELR